MSKKLYRLFVLALSLVASIAPAVEVYAAKAFDDRYYTEGIRYYRPDDCSGGTSGVVVSGEAVISGTTADEKVWSGLKSLGLTDEVTAGIMGNMSHESNQFNPVQHEGSWLMNYGKAGKDFDLSSNEGKAYGLGLIQWSFGRRVRMYNYVKDHNASLLKYFDQPMKYSHANGTVFGVNGNKFIQLADSESDVDALYSLELTFLVNEELKPNSGYSGIFDQTTVVGASDYFLEHVEKPANIPATRPGRRNTAEEMFSKFSGKTSFAGGTGGNGNGASRATVSASNDGSNVTWIGDSLSTGSLNYGFIKEKWSKADAVYNDSIKGRKQFDQTNGENKSGQQLVEEYEVSGRMRQVLVFALGTNSPHLTEQIIKNMLNAAKTPKTIVMMTSYDNGEPNKFDSNNALIRNAKSYDSRVVVADWATAAKEHAAEFFDPSDDVHPKKEGYKYFVELIYRAAITGFAQSINTGDTQCVCDEVSKTDTWADEEFDLTDEQVAGLLAIIKDTSKNNLEAIKTEASYMINLYEDYNPNNSRTGDGFVKYVRMSVQSGGKFPNHEKYKEDFTNYTKEEFAAVKDIWVNGNRTMPVGIVKRTKIEDVGGASNDGKAIDATNRKKYISGKTKITKDGETWVFYKFADDKNRKGDAFGYAENASPNQTSRSTSTAAGASIAWSSDGWISGGLEGYYKDEASSWGIKVDKAANKEFATEVGTGGGSKGPNKILLHSSESAGGFEDTVKTMYSPSYSDADRDTASRPPHFTVDIKNHKVYQHFSIRRTSGAIKDHDDIAGIQISIIGYTADETTGGEWNLRKKTNFSSDDWKYLLALMMSISEKTGAKIESKNLNWKSSDDKMSVSQMESFNGVMGHMHAADNNNSDPKDIWQFIEPLIEVSESGTGQCQIEESTNGDLNATALKLAWPDRGHDPDNPTEAYRQALLEPNGVGARGQGDHCSIVGKSCDAFVATVLRHSGVDPDVPCCGAANMLNYMAGSSKYTEIENSASALKGGDIRASGGHIEMVVEVNGELGIASASHCNRTGEVGGFYENSFRAFRFTGGGN